MKASTVFFKIGLTFLVAVVPLTVLHVLIANDSDSAVVTFGILLGAAVTFLSLGAISRIWNG